jgi:hypothetical protein
MSVDSSPGNSPKKRAFLPALAGWIFYLLRRFWLVELALVVVVIIGLLTGWSTPRQWSDGLFVGAFAQIAVAGVAMVGSLRETADASAVRYVADANMDETRHQLVEKTLHMEKFAVRAFVGGVLSLLIAWLVLFV